MRRAKSILKKHKGASINWRRVSRDILKTRVIRSAIAVILAVAAVGCATVPKEARIAPAELLSDDHAAALVFDPALVDELEAAKPGFLERVSGGSAGTIDKFTGYVERVYISLDTSTPENLTFRVAANGAFPIAQIDFAAFFTRNLRRERRGITWYVAGEGQFNFTFPANDLIFGTNEEKFREMSGPVDVQGQRWNHRFPTDVPFAFIVEDRAFITRAFVGQGIPEQIAKQVAVDSLFVELRQVDEGYILAAEIIAPKAIQARLMEAAIKVALAAGRQGASARREERTIFIEGIPVTAIQIADAIESAVAGEEDP